MEEQQRQNQEFQINVTVQRDKIKRLSEDLENQHCLVMIEGITAGKT